MKDFEQYLINTILGGYSTKDDLHYNRAVKASKIIMEKLSNTRPRINNPNVRFFSLIDLSSKADNRTLFDRVTNKFVSISDLL